MENYNGGKIRVLLYVTRTMPCIEISSPNILPITVIHVRSPGTPCICGCNEFHATDKPGVFILSYDNVFLFRELRSGRGSIFGIVQLIVRAAEIYIVADIELSAKLCYVTSEFNIRARARPL